MVGFLLITILKVRAKNPGFKFAYKIRLTLLYSKRDILVFQVVILLDKM
jgi:hypothetical protein